MLGNFHAFIVVWWNDSSSLFSHVFGLAVFGDFLLYSDWDTNSINMIDMDADFRTSLVSNLTRPTAIALYHPDDLSCRYTVCFSINSMHPDDLSGMYTVCFYYNLTLCMLGNFFSFNVVCWADSSSSFSHVFGLAVFGDFLLYSDWDTNSINMIDLDTDFRTSLVSNLTRPTAIALYHPDDLSCRYTVCFSINSMHAG